MSQGTLYIVSAPSGAGKSSLINALIEDNETNDIKVSISHTTRSKRPGEKHAVHYHFISKDEFEDNIKKNTFLEYAQVFGNYYGTSKLWIEENLNQGIDIILDIDWQGARQIRTQMPDVKTIFILPPSRAELLKRLVNRAQDSEEVIAKRMQEACSEISHYNEFDYVIINDDFDTALMDLKAIFRSQRLRCEKQKTTHHTLLKGLLA